MKVSLDLGGKAGTVEVANTGIVFKKQKLTWKKLESLLAGDKPAKKTAAKKTSAKKTSAKKTTAKKAGAKKPVGRPKKSATVAKAKTTKSARRPGRPKGSKNKKK